MPLCRAYTRNVNARNANTIPLVQDHEVLNTEFKNIQHLAYEYDKQEQSSCSSSY